MPNFLIGVLAQNTDGGDGSSACDISTILMDEIYFSPLAVISVNACNINTSIMNEIYFSPLSVISVNACPVDTSTMDIIYNI
jgi:hypothetical protein